MSGRKKLVLFLAAAVVTLGSSYWVMRFNDQTPKPNVEIGGVKITRADHDPAGLHTFEIQNERTTSVSNLEVTCVLYAPGKADLIELGRSRAILQGSLAAKEKREFARVPMDRFHPETRAVICFVSGGG